IIWIAAGEAVTAEPIRVAGAVEKERALSPSHPAQRVRRTERRTRDADHEAGPSGGAGPLCADSLTACTNLRKYSSPENTDITKARYNVYRPTAWKSMSSSSSL